MRYSGDVRADEKDGAADGETNGLVEDQLGKDIAPYYIRTEVEA